MLTHREKVRQQTLDEIKERSWRIIADKGIDDLSVNGIARQMGMTPPAFYRYFKNREALVKTLVMDAYQSFRCALETARDNALEQAVSGKLYAVFMAYREWAVTNPNMFGLFAGRRVYGFDRQDPEVMAQSKRVYAIFVDLYRTGLKTGEIKELPVHLAIHPSYFTHMKKKVAADFTDIPVERFHLIVNSACLVHGMISMELSGRLDVLVGDPALFYRYQILDLFHRLGIGRHQESIPDPFHS